MNINCVIRNIPNSIPKNIVANGLRMAGVHTRKRGRGARALPYAHIPASELSFSTRAGGEYQDLPIEKAARFSMYFDPAQFHPDNPNYRLYFDYVRVTDAGKMVIRAGERTW